MMMRESESAPERRVFGPGVGESGRLAFVVPGVRDRLHRVRVAVPQLRLGADAAGNAALVWAERDRRDGDPLGECLWDFVDLATATDEAIAAFARRFGVLGRGTAGDEAARSEPIAAWRAYARGLGALIGIATDLRRGGPTRWEDWPTAAEAPAVLANAEALTGDYRERLADAFRVFASYVLLGEARRYDEPGVGRDLFGRLATDLLAASEVGPALAVDESGRPRLGLSIPATAVLSAWGEVAHWRVDRLADALLCAAVDTWDAEFVHRCGVCGRNYERQGEKKPRADRRSFCSEACRHEAKKEVQRTSARRSYARRKAAAG